jgi:ribosomal protein S18 acetylase RimI-like enzyme
MDVLFRPARPADVDTAVPLIYSSGPAAFDYIFRRDKVTASDFLRRVFVDGRGEFSYRNHVVAEVEGAVVGVGTTFTGQRALNFTLHAARQIIGVYRLAGLGVIRCGLQAEHIIQPPKGDTAILAHLGVAPAWQSQRVGSQLVHYLLAQAQQGGSRTAALDVAATNPRAEALYARLGFVVTEERPSTLANRYGQIVTHRRMVRPLV